VEDKKVQFYPFHAINDFMRNDYRTEVIRYTLNSMSRIPEDVQNSIDRVTKRYVQIPGFRNSAKAPANLRIRPTADIFEKNPGVVAAILRAWAELHPGLRQQVYDLLVSRKWEIMPPEADRTKLPGFLIHWPDGEDFDNLNQAFRDVYPNSQDNNDDISLMIVWISNRLPYQITDEAK
jgi:hypothetical protein